ncbi:CHAT domain-containing tetratricopeptide repeat protein [Thermonema rossianum]|uniref:CHAT domain-containing tetratricopeptide repeat protein n=1 Tax=Thermonema rossianum TaxID=55505 RepID=UPI00057120A1|nr:CHAT domain-containing protein [Thermonema rossianum]
MKAKLTAFFLALLLPWLSPAQIDWRKAKEKVKKGVEQVTDKGIEGALAEGLFGKKRAQYDSLNFSFAIAVADQTGFYEEKNLFYDLGIDKLAVSTLLGHEIDSGEYTPGEEFEESLNLAEILFASNKYKWAEDEFLYAEQKMPLNAKPANKARLYNDLGLLYTTLGNYKTAESYFDKALTVISQELGEDHYLYYATQNNYAILRFHQAYYPEAIQLIENIENKLLQSQKQGMPQAIVLNNHAYMLYTLGLYEEAELLYQKALRIADENIREKNTNYQRMLINLAMLYQENNRLDEAAALYQKAIEIKKKQGKKRHPDYAHLLTLYAALQLQSGKTENVEALLQEALEIYEKKFDKQHPAYASALEQLGRFRLFYGDKRQAIASLKEVLDIRAQTQGTRHPAYNQTKEWLAIAYWKNGMVEDAAALYEEVIKQNDEFIRSFFVSMSTNEREHYWQQMRPAYLRFFNFAFEQQTPVLLRKAYEAWIATKGILLRTDENIRMRIAQAQDPALLSLFDKWTQKKERLAYYYTLSKAELEEQKIDLDALEKEVNTIERELSARSQAFDDVQEKQYQYEQIAAALPAGSALIEFVRLPRFTRQLTNEAQYYAFVVMPSSQAPVLVSIGESSLLERRGIGYYRSNIRLKRTDVRSYDTFFAPLEKTLQSHGVRQLYISADGVYHQLSLASLWAADKEKYLIDLYELTYLSHPTEIVKEAGNAPPLRQALLVGYPIYGTQAVSLLPGTLQEVLSLNQLLKQKGIKTTLLSKESATEGKLKQLLKEQQPQILHIATHGYFLKDIDEASGQVLGIQSEKAGRNPLLRAGLLLSNCAQAFEQDSLALSARGEENGILTAYEVTTLPLHNTRLVALSACETALGEVQAGEGVYGFQRAFREAGAESVAMSLWKVDDEATKELFVQFYNFLLQGLNPHVAFRKAQGVIRKQHPHPYYWAAFVLIGH